MHQRSVQTGRQNGISSKGGTKKTDKVWERIGRLKEKYASVHQYYQIMVRDNGKGTATGLVFEKKAEAPMEDKVLIVSTIRYQLKLHQINHSWSEIVRMMNTQKSVTTTVENIKGETIRIRQCSEPSIQVKEIYSRLKYNTIPMARKKSVWHTDEILKNVKSDNQLVMDG